VIEEKLGYNLKKKRKEKKRVDMEVCCYNLELKERVAFLVQASSLKKPHLPPCPCQERFFISLGTSMSHIF